MMNRENNQPIVKDSYYSSQPIWMEYSFEKIVIMYLRLEPSWLHFLFRRVGKVNTMVVFPDFVVNDES